MEWWEKLCWKRKRGGLYIQWENLSVVLGPAWPCFVVLWYSHVSSAQSLGAFKLRLDSPLHSLKYQCINHNWTNTLLCIGPRLGTPKNHIVLATISVLFIDILTKISVSTVICTIKLSRLEKKKAGGEDGRRYLYFAHTKIMGETLNGWVTKKEKWKKKERNKG